MSFVELAAHMITSDLCYKKDYNVVIIMQPIIIMRAFIQTSCSYTGSLNFFFSPLFICTSHSVR